MLPTVRLICALASRVSAKEPAPSKVLSWVTLKPSDEPVAAVIRCTPALYKLAELLMRKFRSLVVA